MNALRAVGNCNKAKLVIITFFSLIALLACGVMETSEPNNVTFMAGYKPQANLPFVATYVAQEKGYFKEHNLEVEILHTTSGDNIQLLMSGDVDITTSDATSVLKRRSDPGIPITAFALFGQKGQQGFLSLKSSDFNSPKDWEGKTFGYKFSQPPEYLAILENEKVDRTKIQEVRVGFDPRVLSEGQVDILAIFKSNEPDTVRNLGFEVDLWDPADFDVPTLGLTYVTRETDIESEVVEQFLKATMKALEFTIENRDEAIDIVMKYAPEEDRDHQKFMLNTEIDDAQSAITDMNGLGSMTSNQWESLYGHLIRYGALPKEFDIKSAFTIDVLDQVYKGNKLR